MNTTGLVIICVVLFLGYIFVSNGSNKRPAPSPDDAEQKGTHHYSGNESKVTHHDIPQVLAHEWHEKVSRVHYQGYQFDFVSIIGDEEIFDKVSVTRKPTQVKIPLHAIENNGYTGQLHLTHFKEYEANGRRPTAVISVTSDIPEYRKVLSSLYNKITQQNVELDAINIGTSIVVFTPEYILNPRKQGQQISQDPNDMNRY